jgi:adenine-specific DNA glycosylase
VYQIFFKTRHYHRFVERFPTVEVLSQASEDEVLKYWEGLGYYSRTKYSTDWSFVSMAFLFDFHQTSVSNFL